MDVHTVEIDSLIPDPTNVREHGERNIDAIKASLERFGQQKPIVVDGDGVVIAGNGTLGAAQLLGWTELAVVTTELRGAEAKAFAIADNRAGELAEWDREELALALEGLSDEDLLESAGFSQEELGMMMDSLAPAGEPTASGRMGMGADTGDYESSDIRQVILYFSRGDYEALVSFLADYCQANGLESNSDAVISLAEKAGMELQA